jgi:hypothetical protein
MQGSLVAKVMRDIDLCAMRLLISGAEFNTQEQAKPASLQSLRSPLKEFKPQLMFHHRWPPSSRPV